jgi:hypothetical protein
VCGKVRLFAQGEKQEKTQAEICFKGKKAACKKSYFSAQGILMLKSSEFSISPWYNLIDR